MSVYGISSDCRMNNRVKNYVNFTNKRYKAEFIVRLRPKDRIDGSVACLKRVLRSIWNDFQIMVCVFNPILPWRKFRFKIRQFLQKLSLSKSK